MVLLKLFLFLFIPNVLAGAEASKTCELHGAEASGTCNETSFVQIQRSFKPSGRSTKSLSRCIASYADALDEVQPGLGSSIRAHPQTVVATSKRPVIFGVGSGTTGTKSVAEALSRLAKSSKANFEVSHWKHSPEDNCEWFHSLVAKFGLRGESCIDALRKFDYTGFSDSIGALLDMPVYELFVNFYLSFPNARWILTTRSADEWAASRRKHHHSFTPWPIQEPCGLDITNKTSVETLAQSFMRTNDFIRCVVPKDKLLELDLFSGPNDNMMNKLASFTEMSAASHEEFPHSHTLPGNYC